MSSSYSEGDLIPRERVTAVEKQIILHSILNNKMTYKDTAQHIGRSTAVVKAVWKTRFNPILGIHKTLATVPFQKWKDIIQLAKCGKSVEQIKKILRINGATTLTIKKLIRFCQKEKLRLESEMHYIIWLTMNLRPSRPFDKWYGYQPGVEHWLNNVDNERKIIGKIFEAILKILPNAINYQVLMVRCLTE